MSSGSVPLTGAPPLSVKNTQTNSQAHRPSDPVRDELVAKAVHTARELVEITQDLARIDAIEHQIKTLEASLNKAINQGASRDTLEVYGKQIRDLRSFLKVGELQSQHLALHNRLSVAGLSKGEIDSTLVQMTQLERELEQAQFDVKGGGTAREFAEYQAHNRRMEIGTLQSRLNDGGLNPDDEHRLRGRLKDAENSLASLDKSLK